MSIFPVNRPREFFLRMFEPETKTLSYRAEKSETEATHVDLMFGDVREMKVQPILRDLTIDVVDGGYSLSTPDFPDGYVLADRFVLVEDDVDDWEAFDFLEIQEHELIRLYHSHARSSRA
ncbi:hypothetical protein PV646_39030 [Streptomyces sp. ID05-26A]|nr:hypothetical protein [Streptomyces sp. ID05-26A]